MTLSDVILEHDEGSDRYIRLTRNGSLVVLQCRWPFDDDDFINITNRFDYRAIQELLEDYSSSGHGEASALVRGSLAMERETAVIFLDFTNEGEGFMHRRFQVRVPEAALRVARVDPTDVTGVGDD